MTDLKQQGFISDNAVEHLGNSYESVPHLLMRRYLRNVGKKTTTHETYPPIIIIINIILIKGIYVHRKFALALPDQSTIRKWCSNTDCLPGYIQPAFDNLKAKVSENKKLNREFICSLVVDEMSIKRQIEFDGKKMWEYIDVGSSVQKDDMQAAIEAFVVMVVAQQAHWKEPVAYF